jgi:hypothetical protein
MSKPRGTPVKPSAFKSTEAASSTKKPVLKKRKANDKSEDADQDYVGEDPSKTKTDHDEENVEYYQNSAESKDGEDDEGQEGEDVFSGDGGLIENAEQPNDSEQGRVVKEIINSAQKN